MADPAFRYCPLCATPLIEKEIAHALRLVCPVCGFSPFFGPRVVAVVVLYHKAELLLGKRNIEPGKGLWNFCGGYIEQGETVEEAAIREVKEEANLDVDLEKLVGIYSEGAKSHIVIAYQSRILDHQIGSIAVQQEEIAQLAFFPWEALPPLAFPVHQEILRDWKKLNFPK